MDRGSIDNNMNIEERYKYYLDKVCSGQHEPAAVLVLSELLLRLMPSTTPIKDVPLVEPPKAERPKTEQVVYDGPATSSENPFKLASDALRLNLKLHVQDAAVGG